MVKSMGLNVISCDCFAHNDFTWMEVFLCSAHMHIILHAKSDLEHAW